MRLHVWSGKFVGLIFVRGLIFVCKNRAHLRDRSYFSNHHRHTYVIVATFRIVTTQAARLNK